MRLPSLPRPGSPKRRLLWLGALLPPLLLLDALTAYRTPVRIRFDGSTVEWQVNGKSLSAPAALGAISELEVIASPSAYPLGMGPVLVGRGGGALERNSPAGTFRFQSAGAKPIGDWYADRGPEESVLRLPLALHGPFEIQTYFTGKTTNGYTLLLKGSPGASFRLQQEMVSSFASFDIDGKGRVGSGYVWRDWPRALLSMIHTLARACLAGIILVLLTAALGRLGSKRRFLFPIDRLGGRWERALVPLLAGGGFLACVWTATFVLDGLVHVPDSVAYLMQAKFLSAGKLGIPAPPYAEHLDLLFRTNGLLHTFFPIGWPILLSLGERLGHPSIINPFCGLCYLVLLYLLGRDLFGRRTALLALLLGATSSLTIVLFASFMAHGSSSLLTLLSAWLFLRGWKSENSTALALAGLSLGYAFSIRPMTAFAVGIPIGLFALAVGTGNLGRRFRLLVPFALCGFVGCLPLFLQNYLVSGVFGVTVYEQYGNNPISLSNLPMGLVLADMALASVPPALHGWGWPWLWSGISLALAFAFAMVPFLVGRWGREELFLAGVFASLVGCYAFHRMTGLHGFGPRFYMEGFFAVFLLSARGMAELYVLGGRLFGNEGAARATAIAAAGLVAILWLPGVITLPKRLARYEDYNYVKGGLKSALRAGNISRGLVLFTELQWFPWGEAARLIAPDLAGELVFGRRMKDNGKILAAFPDRPVYLWDGSRLTAVSREGL